MTTTRQTMHQYSAFAIKLIRRWYGWVYTGEPWGQNLEECDVDALWAAGLLPQFSIRPTVATVNALLKNDRAIDRNAIMKCCVAARCSAAGKSLKRALTQA